VSEITAALEQAWPPFVLILGLLLVGLVTAVLNLDTAVVFMTPVLLVAARQRGLGTAPFLYGCVFMANASSLFLPGSNLTNLLVLDGGGASGSQFAARMLPMAATLAVVTALGVLLLFRRHLGTAARRPAPAGWPAPIAGGAPRPGEAPAGAAAPALTLSPALPAVAAVTVLVLALRNPALPVLAAAGVELARRRLTVAEALRVVGPAGLLAAFALTVALGRLARSWTGPQQLLAGADGWQTAGIAALSSVAINNLPAAALYSAGSVEHSRMLLLGLNVGPNLAVTGALSALLWHRAATQAGADPSLLAFSRYGTALAVAAIAAALLVVNL